MAESPSGLGSYRRSPDDRTQRAQPFTYMEIVDAKH